MADSKLAALTAETTPTTDDILYLVNDPAGTPGDRKVTVGNLASAMAAMSAFTGAFAPLVPRIIAMAHKRRTSGDITVSGTSWQNLDTGLDITLSGVAAGDLIEVSFSSRWTNVGSNGYVDVATIVSSAVVNYVGGASGTSTGEGILAWGDVTSGFATKGSTVCYTLVSGDISGGSVTLRLRGRVTGSDRALAATSALPLQWAAKAIRVA